MLPPLNNQTVDSTNRRDQPTATARRVDKAEAPSAEAETVMKEIVTRATYVGPVLESILLEKHELVEWEMA